MKLTEEQVSIAMAAFGCVEAPSPNESRGRIRVPSGTRATIIPCGEGARGELLTVVLTNLSDGGLAISSGIPLQVGTHFILRTRATPVHQSMAILCSIIYSQNTSPKMFSIGAQFVRVLAPKAENNDAGQFTPPDSDELQVRDMDHVREVEARLKRLSF